MTKAGGLGASRYATVPPLTQQSQVVNPHVHAPAAPTAQQQSYDDRPSSQALFVAHAVAAQAVAAALAQQQSQISSSFAPAPAASRDQPQSEIADKAAKGSEKPETVVSAPKNRQQRRREAQRQRKAAEAQKLAPTSKAAPAPKNAPAPKGSPASKDPPVPNHAPISKAAPAPQNIQAPKVLPAIKNVSTAKDVPAAKNAQAPNAMPASHHGPAAKITPAAKGVPAAKNAQAPNATPASHHGPTAKDAPAHKPSPAPKPVQAPKSASGPKAAATPKHAPASGTAVAPEQAIVQKSVVGLKIPTAPKVMLAQPQQLSQAASVRVAGDIANAKPALQPTLVSDGDQANQICVPMIRLLLQADIVIHPLGFIKYQGNAWTRVSTQFQPELLSLLDQHCALPLALQEHYIPKIDVNDPDFPYKPAEFTHAPKCSNNGQALKAVAIHCSKVVLALGTKEVVKLALIDMLTGQILLNHLVCPDPPTKVATWHLDTGLRGYADLEVARKADYKILKGWRAARAALFHYVDKDTILVGHELRADTDALRLIHGRGVDIGLMVQTVANGPLSRKQLSLDSLCRDLKNINLPGFTDPICGRDPVTGAFAVREVLLWMVKNHNDLKKWSRARSLEYQRLNPGA